MDDPNKLDVVGDVPSNDPPQNDPAQLPSSNEDDPIIPTPEQLNAPITPEPSTGQFNDVEAPYGRNKDGSPAKKRGRKTPTKDEHFDRLDSVTQNAPRPVKSSQPVQTAAIVTDYRAIAETAANLWFNLPQLILGEDWAPAPEEVKPVAKGFQDYFQAKGISQLDPTISLALILGTYAVVRVTKPTIKTRIQSGVAWLKSKIIRN